MNKTNNIDVTADKKVDLAKLAQQRSKKIIIGELLLLKEKTIKLIDRAEKTLEERQIDLQHIIKGICDVQGHAYSDWNSHQGPHPEINGRIWYFTRTCEICHTTEQRMNPNYEPTQTLKKEN